MMIINSNNVVLSIMIRLVVAIEIEIMLVILNL